MRSRCMSSVSTHSDVAHFLIQHHLTSARIVVAVSGGPDSLCLLHVLRELSEESHLQLVVAHLDHRLRGAESAAEAQFVAATARAWGLPFRIGAANVAALGGNRYEAARAARYAFLAQLAVDVAAQAVAVAHTADDQAETVLMHLLRGAGPAGLSGMRAVAPWEAWAAPEHQQLPPDIIAEGGIAAGAGAQPGARLIRPLLATPRAEVEAYCRTYQLQPRRDPSNDDQRHLRSRIRHDLLPRLQQYNPQIVDALQRTAAACADSEDVVAQLLDGVWPRLVRINGVTAAFDGPTWRALPFGVQREALRRAYRALGGSETLSWERSEAARTVIAGRVGSIVELPDGLNVTVGYNGAFWLGEAPPPVGPRLVGDAQQLAVPGRVALDDGWWIVAAPGIAREPEGPWEAWVVSEALELPLIVRRRQAGDRLRFGQGSRRLQDIFVDARVPRSLRNEWPVVANAQRIVWVPGLRLAADLAAWPGAVAAVQLRLIGDMEGSD